MPSPQYVVGLVALVVVGLAAFAGASYLWLRGIGDQHRRYGPTALGILGLSFLACLATGIGVFFLKYPFAIALAIIVLGSVLGAFAMFAGFSASFAAANWGRREARELGKKMAEGQQEKGGQNGTL